MTTLQAYNNAYSDRRRGGVCCLLDSVERPLAAGRVLPQVSRWTPLQVCRPAAQGVRRQLGGH